MSEQTYDVIVIGARCAGSPTAMLLARKGYKVLVVDRSTFPSDTISTHLIHPVGIAALKRWGILARLVATGCPAIDTYAFDFGPFTIVGSPGTTDAPLAYCPRRTVLDQLLVEAAAEAGAEIREGFVVDEVLMDDGRVTGIRGHAKQDGPSVTIKARIVIGADGKSSLVARAVSPAQYHEKPELQASYYAYWSGLPMHGRFETYIRPNRGFAAIPTHDGLTCIVGGWPYSEFEANKHDIEGNYMKLFDGVPAFAERLRHAKRETKLFGAATPNFFRKPFGPGWVLVGDAGYIKDPITAHGIGDAFRDAEMVSAALDNAFSGRQTFDAALGAFQTARDTQVLPIYELTTQLATLAPPPPQMAQVLGAVAASPESMTGFCRVISGVTSPAEFFSEANVGQMFGRAAAAATSGAPVSTVTHSNT